MLARNLAAYITLPFTAKQKADVQEDSCAVCEEVHFFLARGNNEPYPGRQAKLVEATCDGLTSCGYESLYYSALYTDIYCQSVYDGSIAGHVQLTAYAEKCPKSKLILSGYSQGGQIVGDILGGGGGYSFNGCLQPDTPALSRDTSPGNQIAAIIAFGDTRHDANQTYNYGNGSSIDGYYPRNSTMKANLNTYADIMRNWCVSSDPICAAHQDDSAYNDDDHLKYFDLDSEAAASWIRSVATLSSTATVTTTIPTSLSGTVQDYATIGTATPSGSVTLDTTWTSSTSYTACTATAYTEATSTATAGSSSSPISSSTSTASGTVTASVASIYPLTGAASSSGTVAAATTSAASGADQLGAGRDKDLLVLGVIAACALLRVV